ncbi:MAG: polysaccharide biosynthesis protein [Chloroflexota bacterium]
MGGAPQSGVPPVDLHKLLGRGPLPIDEKALESQVAGRAILITGAGGSIGRVLTTKLLSWRPARLILVDSHENSLYELQGQLGTDAPLVYRLADVRLGTRLSALVRQERPEIVYHLAAYKHVPLGEENPAEVFGANVLGAFNVLRACADSAVEALVYPSTDKAVDPPSTYGASKRLVELLLTAHGRGGGSPRIGIVRLVNAVGAQGGVIRLFARQIAECKPLTLTHERMNRYWISMEEAALVVAQTAFLRQSPAIVVPDSGPALRLTTMAQRLATLLRPEAEPSFRFTGLRLGERLEEYLHRTDEQIEPDEVTGLLRVGDLGASRPDLPSVVAAIGQMAELYTSGQDGELRQMLFDFVRQ